MLRTLVVPLDGSELAERALPYAVRIARGSAGRLVLVRTTERNTAAEARAYLDQVAEKLAHRVPVETTMPATHPLDGILATIIEFEADEVVMATHGRTGPAHLLYGSVAEAVLARCPVPVFLVHARPGEAVPPPFDPGSARILVPLDGSEFAEGCLPVALDMLGMAGELLLVRAVHDARQTTAASDYLQGIARSLRQRDPGVHVACETRVGEAASSIVMAQVERGADLVVMATHGRTGLDRSIAGSVAGAVLRMGATPVLLVKTAGGDTESDAEPATSGFIVA